MQRLRRLFARTRLEKEEVNILRGILSACEKRMQTFQAIAPRAIAVDSSGASGEISAESSVERSAKN